MASQLRSTRRSGDPDRVEILLDADRPGGRVLLLDRVRQSYVDLDEPSYLDFEYMRWAARIFDALPAGPLAVTHVGGGAGTLVRYLSAVRPGSTHIVCEPDVELTELVRARLPFARYVRVRIRAVDGRAGVAGLGRGRADAVVLDAFAGGRVPAELTTAEFFVDVARILRPEGLVVANVGDGGGLEYTRRVVAGLLGALPQALLITDKGVLAGRRYGNIVLAAARSTLPLDGIRRGLAGDPFPSQLVTGIQLQRWVEGHAAFTADDARRSPAPPEETWRVARASDFLTE
ncbi:MAG: fused MFS/spermidine synthase [Actinomycetota bacterium]|nr:fused MFS/spermidine synthase [Actinomycetota bacterium]